MPADVRVYSDLNALSLHAAQAAVTVIRNAVDEAGTCSVVLSGGSTPRVLYALFASRFRDEIPWTQVHLFWGDERYVPQADAQSNYHMAKETLLEHIPCPAANIHPMPTHAADPDAAARDYEATLRSHFPGAWPRFDLLILGLGSEGHTASIFPESPAVAERTRWVLAVTAPAEPAVRLTLTPPALSQSAHVFFLVAGSEKAGALSHVVSGTADPQIYPAAAIRTAEGTTTWWVDRGAARELAA
jgi:6-phosphogluconolactonase